MLTNIFKKTRGFLYVALLLFCMAALVVFPQRYVKTASDGIKIWAVTVLPSLLPFFFLTALLSKTEVLSVLTGKTDKITRFLYRQNGLAAYVQIMSFLSGYPIGAKLVADLFKGGVIDESAATKLSVVSSTSGPLFIVGGIGIGLFQDVKTGYIILISHVLSSIATGIIFRPIRSCDGKTVLPSANCDNVLYESAYSSVISVAIVGAFIAIFYTFSNIVYDSKILYPLQLLLSKAFDENISKGILIGLIECTTGIKSIALSPITPVSVSLSCALITLGGVSVWCQSIIYLSQAKVKIKTFILAKFLQAIIAFSLCFLLFYLF